MKLFIPALGTSLRLTKPWKFSLFCEERNKKLWDLLTDRAPMDRIPVRHRRGNMVPVTLPAGTDLKVSRIFIRKGAQSYDSVTFWAWVQHMGVVHRVRFWVPLAAANDINCEVI